MTFHADATRTVGINDAFWDDSPLPVVAYLSPASRTLLNAYLEEGNRALREKKLLEFLKCVDWMPLSELVDSGVLPLERWKASEQRRLYSDLNAYLLDKAQNKQQASEKRQEYKLKVIEYFRARVPRADKILLESLRDYELDLTGRDTNWRHYFTLDSFKKIDEFVDADLATRQHRMTAFRQDVETYKRNYEKLKHQAQCDHSFSFDDWCEQVIDADLAGEFSQRARTGKTASRPSSVDTTVERAYQEMELPFGTAMDEVKKQFRQLTLRHHPDVPGGCGERMQRVLSAYDEISRYLKRLRGLRPFI